MNGLASMKDDLHTRRGSSAISVSAPRLQSFEDP